MEKRGPNWIEVRPGTWINLRRANKIGFNGACKDGVAVTIDTTEYIVNRSVEQAIVRWLSLQEIKPT